MENSKLLHKLARLRSQAVEARDEAQACYEWFWSGYLRDLIANVDHEMRKAAGEAAFEQLRRNAQQSLFKDDDPNPAS